MKRVRLIDQEDKKQEIFYNIIILSLILGIIITSAATFYFRYFVYGKDNYFSELFFSDPDKIPNRININKSYDFVFSVKSHENKTNNYKYIYGMELYNLYDDTESKYHCLGRYRDRIYLEWINRTSILKNVTSHIENMAVYPDYKRIINWSEYNLELGFSPPVGKGKLMIYFANRSDLKYTITIDEKNNLTKFNNKTIGTADSLHTKGNNIKITVKDNNIRLYHNKELILSRNSDDLYNGSFGIETSGAYFDIRGFTVYKDSLVSVPDQDTIIPYNIISSVLHKKIYEIRNIRTKNIPLKREYIDYNETVNCEKEPFYCRYFDLANDISFNLNYTNLTKVAEKIPVMGTNYNLLMHPVNINSSFINWTTFSVDFSHSRIKPGSRGSVIFKFGNFWGIMMTRNNSYYMRQFNQGIRIDEIRNPEKIDKKDTDNILINITAGNIILTINDKIIFSKPLPETYTGGFPEIYIKNDFLYVDPVRINNQDPLCNDILNLKFCSLVLETSMRRSQRSTQNQDFKIDYFDYSENELSRDIFSSGKNTSVKDIDPQLQPIIKNITKNTTHPKKPVYNLPVENPYISDKKVIFNTASSAIINSSNYSASYGFNSLDGARIEELGLLDFFENEIISIRSLEKQDRILIYSFDGNNTELEKIDVLINESRPHKMEIRVIDNSAEFYFDYKKIHEQANPLIKNGFIFAGTKNTHAELGDVHIEKYDKEQKQNYRIDEDPCRLRIIEKWKYNNTFRLHPSQSINITGKFNVSQDFDYGKVFVDLYGSGDMPENKPLSIHFWVMRDDN
ncbi:hypothetical protein GF327_02815 [Candidatus Woesearchaeota archaeon]|nr:hypothetical protein [Candidatus Woesearchaeota archaeon]